MPAKISDSFLVSFHDASVNAHAIANRKRFGIIFLLFFLNRIDDLIHNSSPAARLRAHTLIRRHGFLQPEIANHLSTKHEHAQDNIRKSVKISGICG